MSNAGIHYPTYGVCKSCGGRVGTVAVASCPSCGGIVVAEGGGRGRSKIGFLSLPPMLYERAYLWFVLVSALDIMLTWVILVLGGTEVNFIADAVIKHSGHIGIILYKFCLVIFIVVNCEIIGRRRPDTGRKLAEWSVAIGAIPVELSVIQLFMAD